MPQKQTHQIAITALRSAAPASGGFGPDRCGRVPSLAIAVRSANTWSTKTSTSANASQGPADVFAGRTAVLILCGLDAVDDGLRDGLSSFRAPRSIQPQVAVTSTTVGVSSLQTDSNRRATLAAIGSTCPPSVPARAATSLRRSFHAPPRLKIYCDALMHNCIVDSWSHPKAAQVDRELRSSTRRRANTAKAAPDPAVEETATAIVEPDDSESVRPPAP